MRRSNRHIASGIKAVIDSAHVVHPTDIWVDSEDVGETLNQICKLVGSKHFSPRIYNGDTDRRVCIRLD